MSDEKSFIQRFNESWIFEMPRYTGPSGHNPFSDLKTVIEANIENGHQPNNLGNNLFNLIIDQFEIYYWVSINSQIKIAARMSRFKNGLSVEIVGKEPGYEQFASEFYQSILLTIPGSLLFSGSLLSKEGLSVWKRLLNSGNVIMVYDPDNTKNFQKLNTVDDLQKFLGNTENYEKYRYVLSKNQTVQETIISELNLLRAYKLTFNIKE